MVLRGGGNDMVALLASLSREHCPLYRQIVTFRTTRGEDDLGRFTSKELRKLLPRDIDRIPGGSPTAVRARRVRPIALQRLTNGLDGSRVNGRRRVEIKVNHWGKMIPK